MSNTTETAAGPAFTPAEVTLPNVVTPRAQAFTNITGAGEAMITCVYGKAGSGKALLTSDLYNSAACPQPVIFDGEQSRAYIYPEISPVTSIDEHQIELARRLAKQALLQALQGKNVILTCTRADIAFDYLYDYLQKLNSEKIRVKYRGDIEGVSISLRLVETQKICTFYK